MIDFDQIAAEIKNSGDSHVFGIPGGGASLDLVDSVERKDIEFVTTFTEGAAAIMAGTLGFLDRTTGVAMSIKGPGLANMIPGLSFCFFENLP
ncbi:MAG: thiamine pyrophosphate-binding protein, partial [Gammaproteobacteria bacterium]